MRNGKHGMAYHVASRSLRRASTLWIVLLALALLVPVAGASAQEATEIQADEGSEPVEEFVVTGSHIQRVTFEGPSPVEVIGREDMEIQAPQSMTDITRRLTANSGAEFQEDQFTANATSGTASVNLRGLGLGSTLVLLNGKRAVASPGAPNSGATFVDINNFPVNMIERIEIVKDGTAALYGSDAVAGVVNFITRKNFTGLELNGSWQTTSRGIFSNDAQEDSRLSLLMGAAGDRTRVTGVVSWLDRTPLDANERRFTRTYDPEGIRLGTSNLSNPPTLIPLGAAPGFTPLAPNPDPACATDGTNTRIVPFADPDGPGPLSAGFGCQYQFSDAFQIVAEETRIDGYTTFEHDFTDTIQAYAEAGFNFHRNKRTTSPSFPGRLFPSVPRAVVTAANPGNPTNSAPGAGDGASVIWIGRPFGDINNANDGTETSKNQLDTWRFVGGVKGDLGDLVDQATFGAPSPNLGVFDTWNWDLSYVWSTSRLELRTNDVLEQNLVDALNGFGGVDCDRVNGTAGTAPCFYFNPFGNARTAQPGDPHFNTQEVIDDILAKIIARTETGLQTVDGTLSGGILDLPGGELGVAVGSQFRHEEFKFRSDDNSNEDRFFFTVGTPHAQARRDIAAVFGEISAPVWYGVEAQAAVRYERYSTAGESTDPKVGLRVRPFDALQVDSPVDVTLRGNYSTAFRAPSLFQENATQTILEQFEVETGGVTTTSFGPVRNFSGDDLDNEESTTWSAGATLGFLGNDLTFSVDGWLFEYEDVVVKPSAQAIIDAAVAQGTPSGSCPTGIQGCVQIIHSGSLAVASNIARIETEFFNAGSIDTRGLDLQANYHLDPLDYWNMPAEIGTFDVIGKATYIDKFQIQESAGSERMDAAGRRNFRTFASSLPRWRFNGRLIWSWRNHTLSNNVQFISEYRDDQCFSCPTGKNTRRIDSMVTWDTVYNIHLDGFGEGTTLQVAVLNIMDELPPPVATNGGFDTRIHDPRGRMFQVGFTQRF